MTTDIMLATILGRGPFWDVAGSHHKFHYSWDGPLGTEIVQRNGWDPRFKLVILNPGLLQTKPKKITLEYLEQTPKAFLNLDRFIICIHVDK